MTQPTCSGFQTLKQKWKFFAPTNVNMWCCCSFRSDEMFIMLQKGFGIGHLQFLADKKTWKFSFTGSAVSSHGIFDSVRRTPLWPLTVSSLWSRDAEWVFWKSGFSNLSLALWEMEDYLSVSEKRSNFSSKVEIIGCLKSRKSSQNSQKFSKFTKFSKFIKTEDQFSFRKLVGFALSILLNTTQKNCQNAVKKRN